MKQSSMQKMFSVSVTVTSCVFCTVFFSRFEELSFVHIYISTKNKVVRHDLFQKFLFCVIVLYYFKKRHKSD